VGAVDVVDRVVADVKRSAGGDPCAGQRDLEDTRSGLADAYLGGDDDRVEEAQEAEGA
jgi:hypothetical protein